MIPCRVERVIFFDGVIDFRKKFDGLLAASYCGGFDPYAGDCVVFIKRDRSQLRALVGDGKGLFLISRRFEGSSIQVSKLLIGKEISVAELSMLFDGSEYVIKKKVRDWKPDLT